jgi:hypothetical protein
VIRPVLVGVLVLGLAGCRTTIVEVADPPRAGAGRDAGAEPGELALDEQTVRAAVQRYIAALAARDPVAASAAVVPDTFDYYEQLRVAALQASRDQLESLGLMSVMLVLQIRMRSSRAELEQLDGHGLFSAAIVSGMAIEAIDLEHIWIDEAREHAEVRIDGEAVLWLRSVADPDSDRPPQWRLDLPAMIVALEPRFEAVAREQVSAEGRVRMAYALIELTHEGVIDLDILDGPLDTIAPPKTPAPASQP